MIDMSLNKFVDKDEYTANTKNVNKTLHGIANAISINHRQMLDWQKKSLIIAFIISAAIIISLVTTIIVTYVYVDQINKNIQTMTTLIQTQNETMDKIQNNINTLNQEIINLKKMTEEMTKIETEVKEIEETVDPKPEVIPYNYTDITSKSGFTAEQFNRIINHAFSKMNKSATKLTDIGAGLYSVETEYNVNGLYLLGIASIESGWGTSNLAKKSNNIYGLIGKKFSSIDDCTMYMGKLLRNSYIDKGYTNLSKIQKKYCPNSTKWVGDVKWCANKYISAAKELYPQ